MALGGRVRVITTGSAPISDNVLSVLRCIVGCPILEGYGQTECSGVCSLTLVGDCEPGHVGPPMPCNIIKLIDVPDMNYFSKENRGEICVSGPTVFLGYLKDQEKTKEALDDGGWLRTGDIGQWQPGEYIAPEKIENILVQSPWVAQVFVHGDSLQSFIIAIVVPDAENIPALAAKHGFRGTFQELVDNPEIKQIILNNLADIGKTNGLTSLEQVQDIKLHPELFSVENGLLTPTFKYKRHEISRFFAKDFERMYATPQRERRDKQRSAGSRDRQGSVGSGDTCEAYCFLLVCDNEHVWECPECSDVGSSNNQISKKTDRSSRQKKKVRGDKGQGARNTWDPLGYEGGQRPLIDSVPCERYYGQYAVRRQYPPLSLLELQRLIDLNRVDVTKPVDIASICNTGLYKFDVAQNHFGVNITEERCDIFAAKLNLEVQWTNELVIAAVERSGGTITTRYYDPQCLTALFNPLAFFKKGLPIPKCKLPPQDALAYYTDPEFRGYLADPEKILLTREKLARKYGFKLPDLSADPVKDLLLMRKDPLQIFYGLEPSLIVNLTDKCILKPKDEDYLRYYYNVH